MTSARVHEWLRGIWRMPGAWAVLGTLGVAAAHAWLIASFSRGFPGFDVYAYTYPNFLYAHDALERGYGLLWNDFQNCGQPFFAIISTALLNPVNALSFLLDPGVAIDVKVFVNLAIGGIGAYLLCRELGLGPIAALCGSMAFVGGGANAVLARTGSFEHGAYVWLPAAAFLCERILRRPTVAAGIGLGVTLTIQLLAGFPQIVMFTYQWIALRVAFELATHRGLLREGALGPLALGLVAPPLLGAVQLFPSLELVGQSLRSGALSASEINPHGSAWDVFVDLLNRRIWGAAHSFTIIGVTLVGVALAASTARRIAFFFFCAAALYFLLSFNSTAFELYQQLPFGRTFRDSGRFIWMTSFCISLLIAVGAEAITRDRHDPMKARIGVPAVLAAAASLHFLIPNGLFWWEWGLVLATLGAIGFSSFSPRGRVIAAVAIPLLLACNLAGVAIRTATTLAPFPIGGEAASLRGQAWAFDRADAETDGRYRIYERGVHFDYSLTRKSASVFRVPSIADYEPQSSKRYAKLFMRMRLDAPMATLNEFNFHAAGLPQNRQLFDLLAARSLIIDHEAEDDPSALQPALRLIEERGTIGVYANDDALPRAFFVPRVEVVPDADALLERLASPRHHPQRVALVEESPADGFFGYTAPAGGVVEIRSSRGEELVIHVDAPNDGFLFVSDQYYPGWEATVDETPTPILRANYAFR
ncbi:MAG: hypothetical protein JRG80_19230, partial [Deltaproteobacteria bacterium]|nr:hypothetical protein [Deltaproteobacteria bacterium]